MNKNIIRQRFKFPSPAKFLINLKGRVSNELTRDGAGSGLSGQLQPEYEDDSRAELCNEAECGASGS